MSLVTVTADVDLIAGCYKITTVFSHAQTVVLCVGCSTVLCQPTGGKARLTEGTDTSCLLVYTYILAIHKFIVPQDGGYLAISHCEAERDG